MKRDTATKAAANKKINKGATTNANKQNISMNLPRRKEHRNHIKAKQSRVASNSRVRDISLEIDDISHDLGL